MIEQIAHFREEVSDLSRLLADAPSNAWSLETQFKNWTVEDVILHLYASDNLAIASATGEAEYRALRADVMAQRANGLSMIEESRRRFPSLRGERLCASWITQADDLCALLARSDPAAE